MRFVMNSSVVRSLFPYEQGRLRILEKLQNLRAWFKFLSNFGLVIALLFVWIGEEKWLGLWKSLELALGGSSGGTVVYIGRDLRLLICGDLLWPSKRTRLPKVQIKIQRSLHRCVHFSLLHLCLTRLLFYPTNDRLFRVSFQRTSAWLLFLLCIVIFSDSSLFQESTTP